MPIVSHPDGAVLELEISRPERRNTLDEATLIELTRCLREAGADDQVRAILLRAQPGIFSAGADIAELFESGAPRPGPAADDLIRAMDQLEKPAVACVAGPAVGLAVAILYHCDLVYAASSSLFSIPEVALGLIPRHDVARLAVSGGGYQRAAAKILLAEPISAGEAQAMGLVSACLNDDEVLPAARARARRLSLLSPLALREAKRLLRLARGGDRAACLEQEKVGYDRLARGDEAREACAAFLDGRAPRFGGRGED